MRGGRGNKRATHFEVASASSKSYTFRSSGYFFKFYHSKTVNGYLPFKETVRFEILILIFL